MRTFKYLYAVLSVLVSAPALAAYDLTTRPLLKDGDFVPTVARVGRAQVDSNAIDASGRILISADLSDGTSALFRAEGTRLETLWRGGAADDPSFIPGSAVTSPNGRVIVSALQDANQPYGGANAVYQVSPPPVRLLVKVGDRTTSGDTIRSLYSGSAASDDGALAIQVYLEPTSATESQRQAVLLVREDGIHVVAAESSALPERRFDSMLVIGLSAAGEVFIDGRRYDPLPYTKRGLYAAGIDRIRPILVEGDRSPDGFPFLWVNPIAAALNGEALLYACDDRPLTPPNDPDCECLDWQRQCAIYRTDNGQLRRVAAADERTPDGYRFLVDGGSLADNGDAVVRALWVDEFRPEPENDPLWTGLLLYRPGESVRQIAAPARGGASNNDGDVVVVPVAGEQTLGVSRWRNGETTALVDGESQTDDGALMIGGGLVGPHCLAPDGRAATFARFSDGGAALVCIDDAGTHVVTPFADTDSFYRLQCAFGAAGEMIFADRAAVFRAGVGGVETIVGPGTVTDRGTTIDWIDRWSAPFQSVSFSVNAAGTVVARGYENSTATTVLVRQRRGSALEEIPLTLSGGVALREPIHAEVADDETIIALGRLEGDPRFPDDDATVVVAFDDDGGRILFTDGALGGTPNALLVRGALVAISIDNSATPYVYDLRDDTLQAMFEPSHSLELNSSPFLIDYAANGGAVFFAHARSAQAQTIYGRWLFSEDGIQLLSSDTPFNIPTTDPVALNAIGNILFEAIDSRPQVLSMSGPHATGRCQTVGATESDGSDGCQTGGTAHGPWWLLGPLVLALGMRRRSAP